MVMFKQGVQEELEVLIQRVELEASLALQISWRMDSLGSVHSPSQPSEASTSTCDYKSM